MVPFPIPQSRPCCEVELHAPQHGLAVTTSEMMNLQDRKCPNTFYHLDMHQICLDFPGVSQKWLSYITVNWISLTGLSGMTEFGPLLYNCAIKK